MGDHRMNRRDLFRRGAAGGLGLAGLGMAAGRLDVAGALAATPHATAAPPITVQGDTLHVFSNNLPPRIQWDENYGYCGETAMVSAGLYYGQYVSQYDARAFASKNEPQDQEGSQLLVDTNAVYAANQMRMNAVKYNTDNEDSTASFLAWVKQNVVKGYPVAIGVFINQHLFQLSDDPSAGDPNYDHIVLVTGVGSNHPLTDPAYYPDDTIYFSDGGEWPLNDDPQYIFEYPFAAFQKNRQQANAHNGPVYSTLNNGTNLGVVITGVADLNHDTLPVWVNTSANYEQPEIVDGSPTRPKPMALSLTITVLGMQPGVKYQLYRYASFGAVPTSRFNANAHSAKKAWSIQSASGTGYTVTDQIMSNEIAVYRAVPASAG
jgi:hypothetical protein